MTTIWLFIIANIGFLSGFFCRSLLVCWILASSALGKYRNSPIHYIKLKPFGSGFDLNSLRNLANVFSQTKEKVRERDKSYKGRKISTFYDKSDTSNSYSNSKLNFIKLGKNKKKDYQKYKTKPFMNEITNNDIFRPKLNFTSNAKPEILKYRDVKVAKTEIVTKPSKELTRLNKKYSGKVPFHFGYSRKFQDYPVGKSFIRSSDPSSSMTWLKTSRLGNGKPTSILHLNYPVKITRLSSGKNIKSEYYDNFL